MTEDYLKNRQVDSIRGSAHFLNRVSRITHENKRIVFLLLASWPTILLSSPQRTRIPPHPSLMSKMSTIPSIPSIHPLLNRKPNSYLLVCEKRKREEELKRKRQEEERKRQENELRQRAAQITLPPTMDVSDSDSSSEASDTERRGRGALREELRNREVDYDLQDADIRCLPSVSEARNPKPTPSKRKKRQRK